jgi:hypothetical protein
MVERQCSERSSIRKEGLERPGIDEAFALNLSSDTCGEVEDSNHGSRHSVPSCST